MYLPPRELRLSEVISALSYALDLTEGQPLGHSVRSCAIGMRVAEGIGLGEAQRSALFYALLLKDAGCSSNAAKVASLFGADDREVKRDRKLTDHRRPRQGLPHVVRNTLPGGTPLARARQLAGVARHGSAGARQLIEIRCERGAEIARMVDLPEEAAQAIRALDEHWDGGGYPSGLAREAIPILGRVLGLAQTVEVFFSAQGLDAALAMARERSGTWFDPGLVRVLEAMRADQDFWSALEGRDPQALVGRYEPAERVIVADEARLDRVAEAFARVTDAKSPYTGRHSEEVARVAVGIAGALGLPWREVTDLRRAALLHDVGKLGLSNLILDKPGRLTDAEWAQVREHPAETVRILSRVTAFRELAQTAGAHHERLDGSGYPRGLTGEELGPLARVLAVADVYAALTEARPYRAALASEEALAVVRRAAGTELCPRAVEGLEAWLEGPAGNAGASLPALLAR